MTQGEFLGSGRQRCRSRLSPQRAVCSASTAPPPSPGARPQPGPPRDPDLVDRRGTPRFLGKQRPSSGVSHRGRAPLTGPRAESSLPPQLGKPPPGTLAATPVPRTPPPGPEGATNTSGTRPGRDLHAAALQPRAGRGLSPHRAPASPRSRPRPTWRARLSKEPASRRLPARASPPHALPGR